MKGPVQNAMKAADEPTVSGAQAIERACLILREVARRGQGGARLVDLTQATRLSRPTVHRILQSLAKEGFIRQQPSRKYALGSALFELGLSAPSPLRNLERFRPVIEDLATRSGDTAYLMMRSADDVLYLMRAEGAYPIRTYVIAVGERMPMVASLGGIALLAALQDEHAETIIRRAETFGPSFRNASPEQVRTEIRFVREHGYGWGVDVVMEGVAGLAASVPNADGIPYLAVSISAISSRLEAGRAELLGKMLIKTCAKLADLARG